MALKLTGAYYLFTLRLVPLFPFFVINLVVGITRLPARTYYWVSQLGMLPGTLVYINAGTQIGKLESLSGILSPGILLSFILLGIFPLLTKKIMAYFSRREYYRRYPKPDSFDTNLVVIGAGSAGLVAAYVAAAAKAKVTLVEKDRMGGDCLNTGCVPSKALLSSARAMAGVRRGRDFGLISPVARVDFGKVMERVQRIIGQIEPHDSIERYTGLGVDCRQGEARIRTPYSVEINGETVTTRSIIIASGGKPAVPPIPGIEEIAYLTSDTIWGLEELPQNLLILGGGAIGCELAQAFCRLGSRVTMVEMMPRLLASEDHEVSDTLERQLLLEGVTILTGYLGVAFENRDGEKLLRCEREATAVEVGFDEVLVAVGRTASTAKLGLDELSIARNKNGTIAVNEFLQTNHPSIYACGDVAGPFQLTHAAAHQAWYCTMNALFGDFKKFAVDYSVIPRAIFTDPEVARVGLNETEARQQKLQYDAIRFDLEDLDRAITESTEQGFVKVLTPPHSDRILGVTTVGSHAAEILGEYSLAMRHGLGLRKILSTVHIYPTMSEANKFAAGEWQKRHLSPRLLAIAQRFHSWRRL